MPNIPKAGFGNEIVKWIDWLSMQDEQTVKSSIELFDKEFCLNQLKELEK